MTIKLSKPNVPVDIATEIDLVFDNTNQALQVYKIVKLDNVISPYTIQHNLGYKPVVIGYGDFNYDPNDEQIVQLDISIGDNDVTIHNDVQKAYVIIFLNKLE